jgi:PAS domain S-box-containing protein
MQKPMRVLVLEGRIPEFESIARELRRSWPNLVCRRLSRMDEYAAALAEGHDIIVANCAFQAECSSPDCGALHALGQVNERSLDIPFVVLGEAVKEASPTRCVRNGAAEYLLKDRLAGLGPAIARALMEKVLRAQKVRAEAELSRSKEYYRRLVETVKAIPWELDPADWHFTYIGPQVTRLLGYTTRNGCLHEDWIAKIHPVDRPQVTQALQAALVPGRDQDFVHRLLAADGSTVWMRSIVASLSRGAAPSLLHGFTVDITAAKRAEQALARRAEELGRSNKDLEDFAYVASHDLQEPLRMVSSYAELLADRYMGRLDPDADEFIGFITEGVGRMQVLIRDLLAYSRVGTSGRDFVSTESEAVFAKALENLRAAVLESGATVSHDALPVVKADPGQLSQVFQNLIGNSIKFRRADPPEVSVSARESDAEWVFSVADNGIGIESQYYEGIFNLFHRLHTTQEYGGTGIGLTVCKKIVERHGGRIWVESEVGKGSTFHFTIPKANGVSR